MKSSLVGFKVHCYLATRPEVESLRVQSFVVSLKSFILKEEPDISLSIVHSKAFTYLSVCSIAIFLFPSYIVLFIFDAAI